VGTIRTFFLEYTLLSAYFLQGVPWKEVQLFVFQGFDRWDWAVSFENLVFFIWSLEEKCVKKINFWHHSMNIQYFFCSEKMLSWNLPGGIHFHHTWSLLTKKWAFIRGVKFAFLAFFDILGIFRYALKSSFFN